MQEESQNILLNVQLRDERKKKNWTQTELAEKLGVAELTVRRWERGQVAPSAYHTKKLCDLFNMTSEELGLVRTEPLKTTVDPEENVTQEVLAKNAENNSAQNINVQATPVSQPASEIGQAEQEFIKGALQSNRGYAPWRKRFVPLLALTSGLLIVLASFYASYNLYLHPTPPQSGRPQVGPKLLYQANWSQELNTDTWAGGINWDWSSEEGGEIVTQSQVPNGMLVVPYQPATSNYQVEVQIKRDGYATRDGTVGLAYGVVVGMAGKMGYVCGIGEHHLPEHYFLGQINFNTQPAFYQLADITDRTIHLDEGWHDYLVEVTGHTLLYKLDGKQLAVFTFPVMAPGKIGIYVDHAAIEVRNLKIFAASKP